LPPIGQADISPFEKNLSHAATAAAPCPKGYWPPLCLILSSLWLCFLFAAPGFSFSYHQQGFFAILAPRAPKITMLMRLSSNT
jgi:hypothetical protein